MTSVFDTSVLSESEDDPDYNPPENDENTGRDNSESISDCENCMKNEIGSELKCMSNLTENSKIETKKHAEDVWNKFLSDISETEKSLKYANIVKSMHNTGTEIKSECISDSEICELNMYKSINPLKSIKSADKDAAIVSSSERLTSKRLNIDSVLQVIQSKKQKTGILQKARYDWNTFKRSEGIEEDLKKFNKGKQGFIERQRFLERSELRTFENEKLLRQSLKRA
ncbi:craniofacial development protein 1-like [Argiope bruennichi]|uniref:craniofacial development protein 1-like n=1 Tax=Argiope bruennichi TaxID=94029 RepID=UPI0024941FD5|nr:craniofacial development protein 1-like [Argiope bruennichi]